MQLRLPVRTKPLELQESVDVTPEPAPDWELSGGEAHGHHEAPASSGKLLVFGGLLGAVLLGGMAVLIFGGDNEVVVNLPVPVAEEAPAVVPAPASDPAPAEGVGFARTISRALEIEAGEIGRVKRFLAARTPEEFAPLVRHPEVALPRIREFLAENPPSSVGVRSMKVTSAPGGRFSAALIMDDFSSKRMTLDDAPDGLRVDWEAWVGWSSMSWAKFKEDKPSAPQLFRVTAAPVSYYNYEFKDETLWSAWMLSSPQGDEFLYGFVARNSPTEGKILSAGKESGGVMILMLAFPPNPTANNMCEITEMVAAGWVEQSAAATSAPRKQ
jgi:hypothetical protein